MEDGAGEFLGIGGHNVIAGGSEFQHIVYLLSADAFGIVDVSVRTGDGDYLCAQFCGFLGRSPCHVSESGDGYGLVLEAGAHVLEHGLYKVAGAKAGGFGADERTAKVDALSGEGSCVFVGELLVHSVHIAHLSCTHSDVACGYVGIGAYIAPKFHHIGLAEAHDFSVALASGREVGTALSSAHW